ncbi:MAG: polyprenyl synthetase family protein [Hyphomicrobium sp.]
MTFPTRLAHTAARVDAALAGILTRLGDQGTPDRLLAAMRHAVLVGGKRFRPALVLETAALFGVKDEAAMNAAAAVECLHCYSLVHDDLPAMDNDALRRGQPTVWTAYDEWTAILAGDALQTLAFELLANEAAHKDPVVRMALVTALAQASGAAGMVGGQALDLAAERISDGQSDAIGRDIAGISRMQDMKTGRLIKVACDMGALIGGASQTERAMLLDYGDAVGLAFQISDDLLDVEGSAADVGKATGKDAGQGKATLVSLLGREAARRFMDDTVQRAITALSIFGARAEILTEAARFMGRRQS